MKKYIIVIDQGTTSSRILLINKKAEIIYSDYIELVLNKYSDSRIMQSADEILLSVKSLIKRLFMRFNLKPDEVDSFTITNQRETTVLWDKKTGKVFDDAISWQSAHTKNITDEWKNKGYGDLIFKKTGLLINPYFSASKIKYLLNNYKGNPSDLMFGTIDSFLIYNLSKEKNHYTDITNASRTMLYNIKENKYDQEILDLLEIPNSILPKVLDNDSLFGHIEISGTLIPINAVIGDQSSALFGHLCHSIGQAKITYGTGCFILLNLEDNLLYSKTGLLTTVAWKLNGNKTNYALEGSVFMGGEALKWMRDKLNLINDTRESEEMAYNSIDDKVYVIPAFVGLGAPYWNETIRGAILGLDANTKKEDIMKATLNSIAYQVTDILKVMELENNIKIEDIKVDGGVSNNNYLMQFQADLIKCNLIQNKETEITGLGSSYIAGLKTGFFKNIEEITNLQKIKRIYVPSKDLSKNYLRWKEAVNTISKF
ncbi:FGGY-family carbohydrate kinase [Haploplasma modicum]|uniref:FGGY-family carbohydrate kinase n=1 Tax=Haploplasma modicum TaxID=2150 RepID=UPI00047D16C3|nr:glycerol kinase GlpK [Haploplasma modicum]